MSLRVGMQRSTIQRSALQRDESIGDLKAVAAHWGLLGVLRLGCSPVEDFPAHSHKARNCFEPGRNVPTAFFGPESGAVIGPLGSFPSFRRASKLVNKGSQSRGLYQGPIWFGLYCRYLLRIIPGSILPQRPALLCLTYILASYRLGGKVHQARGRAG